MKSASRQVNELHAVYCATTGHELVLNYQREAAWGNWLTWRRESPFTVDDLRRVIGYLKRQIGSGDRREGCLLFRNLIESPDRFEEDLSLALKARKPPQVPTAKGNYREIPVPPPMAKEAVDDLLNEFGFKPRSRP